MCFYSLKPVSSKPIWGTERQKGKVVVDERSVLCLYGDDCLLCGVLWEAEWVRQGAVQRPVEGVCSSPSSPCKDLLICVIVGERMSISDQTSDILKMTVCTAWSLLPSGPVLIHHAMDPVNLIFWFVRVYCIYIVSTPILNKIKTVLI